MSEREESVDIRKLKSFTFVYTVYMVVSDDPLKWCNTVDLSMTRTVLDC